MSRRTIVTVMATACLAILLPMATTFLVAPRSVATRRIAVPSVTDMCRSADSTLKKDVLPYVRSAGDEVSSMLNEWRRDAPTAADRRGSILGTALGRARDYWRLATVLCLLLIVRHHRRREHRRPRKRLPTRVGRTALQRT